VIIVGKKSNTSMLDQLSINKTERISGTDIDQK
jgi:hypothetical protein